MEDRAPIRDKSAKRISQSHKEYIPVEGDKGQAQATEQEVVKGEQEIEMMIRRKLTVDRFLFGSQSSA